MDWDRVEGNWKQMKGKVKEQWGKLTDDDLTAIDGQRDQLEGKIQERYGLAKTRRRPRSRSGRLARASDSGSYHEAPPGDGRGSFIALRIWGLTSLSRVFAVIGPTSLNASDPSPLTMNVSGTP